MKKILCIFFLIFTILPLFAEESGNKKIFALDPLTDGLLLGTGFCSERAFCSPAESCFLTM